MTFLLDANVLFDFQNSQTLEDLAKASHSVELAIVEEVFDEATLVTVDDSPELKAKKKHAAATLQASRIETISIFPGTMQAALKQALLGGVTGINQKKDRGEAASIAAAAGDDGLVLVTGDKAAVLWALNELHSTGERVMRVPVFVRTLAERSILSASSVRRVADRAASHGAIPSWWSTWVASVGT